MIQKTLLFFLFLNFYNGIAQSEKKIDHQNLIWTRYLFQLELNKKWTLIPEVDERFFIKEWKQNILVLRFQGRYKVNDDVELGVGFAHFSVNTQNPEVNPGFKTPEYRLQQDCTFKQKRGKFGFNQRFQIEERFLNKYDKNGRYVSNDFYLRFRLKAQADYVLWDNKKQSLKAIVSDEIMVNLGSNVVYNTFDQNRMYVALQYGISKSFAFELGYLNSFQQRSTGVDYYDRDVIRLSVFHKLKM